MVDENLDPKIPMATETVLVKVGGQDRKIEAKIAILQDDPRVNDKSYQKALAMGGKGRNTESFDPKSTLVRPAARVVIGPNREVFGKKLKHDDIVMVPEFFCKEDDWSLYYQLIEEMREQQKQGVAKSEWISWHEGAHLISNNPKGSKTYQMIQEKIAKYFGISKQSVGTRFNWYRDSSDWKPFHHDSAAFNPHRARNQNITVGVSFGATRELSFLHAQNKTRVYFPQTNGMLFSFGRDVNIQWKHGINALPEDEQDGRGRISIVLWGLVPDVIEEEGSPPMLEDNTRGNGHSMHHNPRPHHQNGPSDAPRERDDAHHHQRERDNRERVADSRERDRTTFRDRDTNSRGYGGSSGSNLPPPRDVCRDYQRGRCAHGDRCRYEHSDNRDRDRDGQGYGSERGSRRSEYNDPHGRGRERSRERDYDKDDRRYNSRDRHHR